MIKKLSLRIIAALTAALIALFTLQSAIITGATKFVPANLLKTDLSGKKTVIKDISNGTVQEHEQFNGAGTVAIINDGDTATKVDAYGANDWGNNSGIVFELNNKAYCGNASIYAGYDTYPDKYDVYASDSEDTLYTAASLAATGVVCTGDEVSVPINREVKFLAVFLTDYTYNGRIAEIELWSADKDAVETTPGASENLLPSHTQSANGILFGRQSGAVSANDKFDQNGAIAAATDGDTATHCDVYGWDADTGVGVLYTLDNVYHVDKITVYSGLDSMPDSYRIYASDDLDALYGADSLLCSDKATESSFDISVDINAKYVAFILDSDGGRVKEFQVYGGKKTDGTFVKENALVTNLKSAKTIIKSTSNGSVSDHNQFNGAGTLAIINDGDKETKVDAYGANDWGNNSGILFELKEAKYCGNVSIYSGFEDYPDTYDVYASNDLSSLYDSASRVGKSIVCKGEEVTVAVNKEIKYLALFLTDYTYNGRIAEIELWTAEKPTETDPTQGDPTQGDPTQGDPTQGDPTQGDPTQGDPTADNFIARHLAANGAGGVMQDVAGKGFSESDRFAASGDTLKKSIDGDKKTFFDVWGALDWEYPKNVGAKYTLDAVYNVKKAYITAGSAEENGAVKFDVYAAKSFGRLFDENSLVASGVQCKGTTVEIPINAKVGAVAFIVTDYNYVGNNIIRIAEFDLSGSDEAITTDKITWPAAPDSKNILKNAEARKIIAPGGDYSSIREYEYRLMDEQTEVDLSKLTNGNIEKHYDIWSLTETDKPGVLYLLDKNYDISHIHAWAGAYGSELIVNYGYKVYASENIGDLYKEENLVFDYSNIDDTTSEFGLDKKFKKIRYIAFILTDSSDGQWRMREFGAYGSKSSGQSGTSGGDTDPGSESSKGENFIAKHLAENGAGGVMQDVESKGFSESDRFEASGDTLKASIDGDKSTFFEVWGALDWEYPKNIGAKYSLDAVYDVKKAYITAGSTDANGGVKFDVYAAESAGRLFDEKSLVASGVECNGITVSVPINAKVGAVAFIITDYNYKNSNIIKIAEFDLSGSDKAISTEKITWPDVPDSKNILKNASGKKIIAPGGDYSSIREYDYRLMDEQDEIDLSKLADGNIEKHYDIWSLAEGDKPGVLYTLDKYYDISHLHAWAGAYGSELIVNYGYKVYASENIGDLYREENLVFDYSNIDDTTSEFGLEGKLKKIGYIAFILTDSSDGQWRMREFGAYGVKSADQSGFTEPVAETGENFIAKHLAENGAGGVMQDVESKAFSESDRFEASGDTLKASIDGDRSTFFEVWGALDWEYPKNIGAKYSLDAVYDVKKAYITAGSTDANGGVKIDVYAAESAGRLFDEKALVASGVECNGITVSVPINAKVGAVAFIITDYNYKNSNIIKIAEFDLSGSDKAIATEKISWPDAPKSKNILKNAKATKIIAPNGDYLGSKEYEYRFMEEQTEVNLSKLTDDDIEKHYDIWSLTEKDKPGVLYTLDKYYDVSHLHAWAGAYGSELIVNYGYKVYASESVENLFKTKNLVFTYSNVDDTTNEFGAKTELKKVKYIAFILTDSSDGQWRMREFGAYGVRSADQSEPLIEDSIIEGIEAEYYGVATDNLADPIYMGASAYIETLTDGKRDPVEFWGGKDTANSKFVFIYDLYANYDITGVDIFASPDSIEEDSGIHKGIRSAKVYASRKFADLFNGTPVTLKEDYTAPDTADEEAYYSAEAPADWKNARFIAYVFTIGDHRYGACRLEELKAFGSMSAVQDEEAEEEKLPEYIDLKTDDGFLLRIYALDSTDDLTKLGATLKSETLTGKSDLEFINNSLSGYDALALYKITLADSNGNKINTGGRRMRLSLPNNDETVKVACVDDYSAEIVSNGILDDHITVETETLRSYAAVKKVSGVMSSLFSKDAVAPAVITVLALAGAVGIAFSVVSVIKIKTK